MDKNSLYHYCSLDTLISILKYKTFRLSDVNKLNDKRETKAIINLLKESVLGKLKMVFQEGDIIVGMTRESSLIYIVESTINQIMSNNECLQFAFCLSECGDTLSQWRGYGDNGRGVAIGFDIDILKEMIDSVEGITLGKITYVGKSETNLPSFQNIADIIAQQIIDSIRINRLDWTLTNPIGSGTLDKFQRMEIYQNSVFYKDISFVEEQEYRIVYNPETYKSSFFNENEPKDLEGRFPYGVQFKSNGNDLVSYVDLSFADFSDDIVNDIIIGPNCSIDDSDIEYLLKACGLFNTAESIEATKSNSSFIIT